MLNSCGFSNEIARRKLIRVSRQTIFEQFFETILICFFKWNNLTKSAVIYRKYCISIFALIEVRGCAVFRLFIRFARLFSLPFLSLSFSFGTFCFVFYKQSFLILLFFSISFSLAHTRTRARHTQHTSANRLVIQIHGCVSFHPW